MKSEVMSTKETEKSILSAQKFELNGEVISAVPFGSGHINDTFKITTDAANNNLYLLQRINHHIFTNVDGLMNNIEAVCNHLKAKLAHLGEDEVLKRTMTLVQTRDGKKYVKDEAGDYWRVFLLIPETRSYDILETTSQAYSGGMAFGQFQKQLSDLDPKKIVEILPNFHNIEFRLTNLRNAIAKDPVKRVEKVQDLLDYIFEREDKMRTILEMGRANRLPVRITHNDTKFNNVLLDKDDNVQCVIDLDTVMPGYVAYDFGDAIRTIINSAAEDEADLDKVVLNIPLFQSFTSGYLSEAKDFLTDDEVDSLIYAVHLLPYMQAVRFLTDYIDGDTYYKIAYDEHNLVRTKAQLKLVQELEANHAKLTEILAENLLSK
ncbi:phosphotransferase enzyme family protein [Sphingobacterium sp. 1.A.4]|uniref:phosphotransferase enzyme family protein n=1 Tax=Sphingobacterium sp. 1.A.4 TaxID=2044603 RepID=UPI000C0BDB55|nr:aminoglycoside phosphotransferase family protein [Sphingobacterium sp. 1.A.4]